MNGIYNDIDDFTEDDKNFYENLPVQELSSGLLNASYYGNLKTVRDLLIKTRFKEIVTQNDINAAFRYACCSEKIDIVKYLLTSEELDIKADIHYQEEEGLRCACRNSNIEIIDYLLKNKQLKENSNLHINKDEIFINLSEENKIEVLKYLIIDFNMPMTKEINLYLSTKKPIEAKKLFELRKLNNDLKKDLHKNTIKQNKKI